MTKEQREQAKAICNTATPAPWFNFGDWMIHTESNVENNGIRHESVIGTVKKENAEFIAHARTALPAALDALDEMEETTNRVLRHEHAFRSANSELITERDKWKARAEALERAISVSFGQCATCTNEAPHCWESDFNGCINWKFDELRFSSNPVPCQDKNMIECDRCGISFLPTNELCICEKCDSELELQCQDKSEFKRIL